MNCNPQVNQILENETFFQWFMSFLFSKILMYCSFATCDLVSSCWKSLNNIGIFSLLFRTFWDAFHLVGCSSIITTFPMACTTMSNLLPYIVYIRIYSYKLEYPHPFQLSAIQRQLQCFMHLFFKLNTRRK